MKKIPKTIRKLLSIWNKNGYSAEAINVGYCSIFASQILEKHPRGKIMWGEDCQDFRSNVDRFGHCFYKYGKKYYDSECPDGVDFPDDLPYYVRDAQYAEMY